MKTQTSTLGLILLRLSEYRTIGFIMWKKVTFKNYFLAAIIINLLISLSLLVLKSFLPPLAPLFYGRPSGESQLTSFLGLFIAPGVSIVITVVNLLLNLWTEDIFLKRLLATTAVIVSVMSAITIVKIVFLIGYF